MLQLAPELPLLGGKLKKGTEESHRVGAAAINKCGAHWDQDAKRKMAVRLSAVSKEQHLSLTIHKSQMQDAQTSQVLANASTILPSSGPLPVQRMGAQHSTAGGCVHGSGAKRKPNNNSIGPARKKGKSRQQTDQLALESFQRMRMARLDPL